MKKKILIIISILVVLLIIVFCVITQMHKTNYSKGPKYGIINKEGKLIVEPVLDYVMHPILCNDDLLLVRVGDEWSYMDKTGKFIIRRDYGMHEFSEELAAAVNCDNRLFWKSCKYGYINKKGKYVIKPQFDRAHEFSDDMALVEIGKDEAFIDKQGNIRINLKELNNLKSLNKKRKVQDIKQFKNGLSGFRFNDKWGCINKKGQIVIELLYDNLLGFFEGISLIKYKGKYGLINSNGKIVVKPVYEKLKILKNGLSAIQPDGYFDKYGKFIINPEIEKLFPAKLNGKWGFIDRNGKIVVDFIYENAETFNNGLAAVKLNGKWGYIDEEGNLFIKNQFEKAYGFYDSTIDRAAICTGNNRNEKCGFINRKGKIVIPIQYELEDIKFYDGYTLIDGFNKCSYLDINGNIALEVNFETCENFDNNLARVMNYGQWGLINKKGEIVIKPQFDEITPFYNDVAIVTKK